MKKASCVIAGLAVLLGIVLLSSPTRQKEAVALDSEVTVKENFERVIREQQVSQTQPFSLESLHQRCALDSACALRKKLFARYLSYKEQLQTIAHANKDLSFSEQLQLMLQQQQMLFSDAERALLFETDNTWNEFALARLDIAQDVSLSHEQKSAMYEQLLQQQPAQLREAFARTDDLKVANNTTLSFNELAAQLGPERASRLELVSAEQAQWQARLAAAQQALGQMSAADEKQAYLKQYFSGNELRRAQVYLAAH